MATIGGGDETAADRFIELSYGLTKLILMEATSILDMRFSGETNYSNVVDEAMNDRNLIFTANSLLDIGFRSSVEIEECVTRAKSVCTCNGLPLHQHFKSIYISDENHHTVQRDWRLSRLAYTLAILNGSSENPLVARLQMAILNSYLGKDATKP